MKLPKARNTDIVVQEFGRELLVYDLKTNHAHQLNETSLIVFNACGGGQTLDDLKRRHKFTDDLIYFTLAELKRNNLLAEDYQAPFAGMSRREVIRKVGLATVIALPMIASIAAPKAIHAASGSSSDAAIDYCQEVECPYAQTQCQNDGVCCNDPQGCGPGVNPGDCYNTNKAAGAFCDDGNAATTGDVCDGNGNCVGTPVTPP